MKISARNVIKGKVKTITRGTVNGEVIIEVAEGIEIVSIVTLGAIDELGLAVGQDAFAVFKASNTMVAVSHHKRGE
jgi:molybdopterin-binding protein